MRHALVTGGAGFIGSHLVDRLLAEGWKVTVVDNFDPFYDPCIKRNNILSHLEFSSYRLVETDICDLTSMRHMLSGDYDVIVHLAAKAGVRPSIKDPLGYQAVNVGGTQSLLELSKEWGVSQFIFASSSSVYGVNPNVPWREDDCVLMPISPYASTKVSCELLGHVYSYLYSIRFIALRFFTVYGPRQRPDLAIHKFARMMLEGKPVPIYGNGSSRRDYTYVDDIVDGIRAAMDYDKSMYEIFNLGNNETIGLLEMVRALESVFGTHAKLNFRPAQAGDVPQTWADVKKAGDLLGYKPKFDWHSGLRYFARWVSFQRGR